MSLPRLTARLARLEAQAHDVPHGQGIAAVLDDARRLGLTSAHVPLATRSAAELDAQRAALTAQGQTGLVTVAMAEKVAEVQALHANGGDRRSEQFQCDNCHTEKTQRGNSAQYRIARLKRDHSAIAEALARGEYPSVHAAAKAAGLVREPTPLDYLHRYWRKVPSEERLRFLIEMLTPAERRAISTGLLDEEGNTHG